MSRRSYLPAMMIDVDIAGNLKLISLTDAEWRCHISGVMPIAAKSPIRGRLLVGDDIATAEHVAHQAHKPVALARRTMDKLRELRVIVPDDEYGCERVHDFEVWNPAPKVDRTAAARQQRRRDRLRAERDDREAVTATSRRDDHGVTPTKEKGNKNTSPTHTSEDDAAPAAAAGARPGPVCVSDPEERRAA